MAIHAPCQSARLVNWLGELEPEADLHWLLIVWLVAPGSAVSQIGPFADQAACQTAGEALNEKQRSMRWLCVANTSASEAK